MKEKYIKRRRGLKIRHLILIGLIFPFVAVACKSTPAPSTVGVDDKAMLAIAQARAGVEETRSQAEYVDGNIYSPDEWERAENRYAAARKLETPATREEATAQLTEWQALRGDYDFIYKSSLSKCAAAQEGLIAAARESAVKAGADKLVPERFNQVDTLAESSKAKFEKSDYIGSIQDGKQARDRYKVLQTIAEAHNKQAEADENDFFSADPDSYTVAADTGNNAVDLYDQNKIPEAQEEAEDALNRFSQVVKNGWASRLEEKSSLAERSRNASREVRANIASKAEYDAAEQVYNRARTAQGAEDYANAAKLYEESSGLFINARNSTLAKQQIANDALREAEQKLAESKNKAQAAENIIGGE